MLIKGEALLWLGEERMELSEGGIVYLPKNIPHGYRITSDTADLLMITTPGGIEGMFQQAGRDVTTPRPKDFVVTPERLAEVADAYGQVILGPPCRVTREASVSASGGFAISLQPAPPLPRLSARSLTQPAGSPGGRTDERERFMRRTVLSAMALACTAALASTVPAYADGATPSPAATSRPTSTTAPSPVPSATTAPSAAPSAVPSAAPTRAPGSQVSVVPSGAPDTGVASTATRSGADGGLIGGGAAAAFAAGGAAVFLVRRRRATGE